MSILNVDYGLFAIGVPIVGDYEVIEGIQRWKVKVDPMETHELAISLLNISFFEEVMSFWVLQNG